MYRGKIIYLNGLTSSGKTSIVRELSARRGRLLFNLGFDMFEEAIPEWACEAGDNYAAAIIAMYHAACSLSQQGRDVLIDGLIMAMPGLERHYAAVQRIFAGYPLEIVDVYCPLDICRERNVARGDRRPEQSAQQYERAEKHISYALRVDTSLYSAKECADIILSQI